MRGSIVRYSMSTLKCRVMQLESALDAVTANYCQLKKDYDALGAVKDSLMVKLHSYDFLVHSLESAQEEVQELRRLLSEATGIYPVD